MTLDKAEAALERARSDYARAIRAMFNAETVSAQKRHSRRAQTAATRIRDAARDRARLSCDLDALRELRAA